MSINSMSAALTTIHNNFKMFDRAGDTLNDRNKLDGVFSLLDIGFVAGGKYGANKNYADFYGKGDPRGQQSVDAARYIMSHTGEFLSYFQANDRIFDNKDLTAAMTAASKNPPKPVSTPPAVNFQFSRSQARLVMNVLGDITKDNGDLTRKELGTYLAANPNLATTNKPTYDAVKFLQGHAEVFNAIDGFDGKTDGKITNAGLGKFVTMA